MNRDHDHRSSLAYFALSVCAVACAWIALSGAVTMAGPLSPFGWRRLVLVHALATLPVTLLTARATVARAPRLRNPASAAIAVVTGFAIAATSVVAGAVVGPWLDSADAGSIARFWTRLLWCAFLELPWCIAAEAIGSKRMPSVDRDAISVVPRRVNWALAAVVAVVLPAIYAVDLVDKQTLAATEMLQRGRLIEGRETIVALVDVGSRTPLADRSPRGTLQRLDETIANAQDSIERGISPAATTSEKLARARTLAMLGRSSDAAELLSPLAMSEAEAALLLAAILQQEREWKSSSAAYRRTLELLAAAPSDDSRSADQRVRAYNGLAFNARELREYEEAELAYLEGIERVPVAAAHFHFQLGRHYELGGRPLKAAESFDRAAQLEPRNWGAAARARITQLSLSTPGCVLRPPNPASPSNSSDGAASIK